MRRYLYLTAALLLLCLTACGVPRGQEGAYQLYFRAQEGEQALVAESRCLPPDCQDPVEGLLQLLLAGPEGEGLVPAIPNSVTLRGTTLEKGLLTVDLSSRYASLSGIDLTLADYSIVQTLSQVEGVEAVTITAEGEPIPYRDHQRLTAAEAWITME